MKITLKKLTAWLAALLLVFQIMPVFSEEGSASNAVGPIAMYRDALEISAPNNESMLAVGKDVQLGWTDGYNNLTWTTSDEKIATVEGGLVKALSAGTVKITATEKDFSDSITFKVIGEKTEGQNPAEEKTIIMISGNKDKVTYDGQAHTVSYSVSSNKDSFNPEQVNFNGELPSYTECGTYPLELKAEDFTYADDANAEIVVNNGWLQIKPLTATVKASDLTVNAGEEPAYSATVDGLLEGDSVEYSFTQFEQDGRTYILPEADPIQGNYRVNCVAGVLTVLEDTRVEAELGQQFVQSAVIRDAEGHEVSKLDEADPNIALTLSLSVAEPAGTEDPGDRLPADTDAIRMFYRLDNVTAEDGQNGDVSWTWDKANSQLVFKWLAGKKESFTADIPVIPNTPETLGLDGKQFIIARIDGNRGVLLPAEKSATALDVDTSAQVENGKIRYETFEDPMWLFTHVSGNWYRISNNGRYIKIQDASLQLSSEPFAVQLQKKGDKYLISYKGYVFDAPGGNTANGLTAYYGGQQQFALYSADQIATEESRPLAGGSHIIANVKGSQRNMLLDKANDDYTGRLASAQFKLDGDTVIPYGEYVQWNFEHIKGNWYYISNGKGQYLQVTTEGIYLSGSPVPTLVRNKGTQYAFSSLGSEKAYLNNDGDNTEKGFMVVTNQNWMWLSLYSSVREPVVSIPDGEWMITCPSRHFALYVNPANNSQEKVTFQDLDGIAGTVKLPNDLEPTYWTFEHADGNYYYIRTNGKYLNFGKGTFGLSDLPQRIAVFQEDGQYILFDGEKYHLNAGWDGKFAGYYEHNVNNLQKMALVKAYDSLLMFDANGGNITTPVAGIVQPGQKITLPAYAGTKNNQQMIGWSVESNYYKDSAYRKLYLVGEEFTVPEGKTTFYAVFNKQNRKAEFYIRLDGVIPDEPGDYKSNEYSSKIEIADAVKATNWVIDNNTKKNIEGNHISNDVTANLSTLPTDEQVKAAYAAYDPDTQYILWYVVKPMGGNSNWHVDGVLLNRNVKASVTYLKNVDDATKESVNDMPGGFQLNEETLSAGQNAEGTLQTPKRPGFEFLGWNTEPDGTGTQYAAGDKINVDGDITLYARWKSTLEVTIRSNVEEQEAVLSGTEVILTAERSGSYKGAADIIWHRVDPETGEDTVIEGAKEMVYRFNINADNAKYKYYVVLEPIK